MKSSTIAGGSGKQERRPFDFYATPKEATIALMNFINLDKGVVIDEPACGDGAISNVLLNMGYAVNSSDIRHTGFGVAGIDYLKKEFASEAVITNPPFSLAEEFIRKALMESSIVCMLLKAHYWHSKKRLKLFTSNTPSYVLPLTWRPDWMGNGSSPTMDFQWTVWMHGRNGCFYQPLNKPVK
jgi:hypothetical protein